MKSIYLAGPYPRRAEIDGYRKDLEALGFVVTSRWLDPATEAQADPTIGHDALDALKAKANDEIARNDIADIMAADVLVSFTEPDASQVANMRGGRHVEFGIALAWDKKLVIVGRRETVFHYLNDVLQFDAWIGALKFFEWVAEPDAVLQARLNILQVA